MITPNEVGCWIDSSWGHYSSARLIKIAMSLGWNDSEANLSADRYFQGGYVVDEVSDYVFDAADDAEAWLNAEVAPEGYTFSWWDGEFFLRSDEEWEEEGW